MNLIAKTIRPLQVVRAFIGSGFLSGRGSALVTADRATARAMDLLAHLRSRLELPKEPGTRSVAPSSTASVAPLHAPAAPMDEDEITRPSHPAPRHDLRVDEASWESFPASDPPGY